MRYATFPLPSPAAAIRHSEWAFLLTGPVLSGVCTVLFSFTFPPLDTRSEGTTS